MSALQATPPRLWRGLNQTLVAGGQIVLAFMAVTICYDAFMRYLFAMPTSWSLEVNSFMLVYVALVLAGPIQRGDEHIRIEFFAERMPARLQWLMRALVSLIGVVFCVILVWRGGIIAWQSYVYGERVSSAFGTPMVIPYSLIPLGFAMLGGQFLIQLLEAARVILRRPDAEAPHG